MKLFFLLFSKLLRTPIMDNINLHHVALFQKTPFNETEYNDVYAIDFVPCGGLIDIILGKRLPGKVRVLHIEKCQSKDIQRIFAENIEAEFNIEKLDKCLYKKIKNWEPSFQLYGRNCQDFANYLL